MGKFTSTILSPKFFVVAILGGMILWTIFVQSTYIQREIFHIKDSIAFKSYEIGKQNSFYRPVAEALASLTMPKTEEVCEGKERHNIVFVKTHKTGTSTLQNIFFRFGDLRDLKFAVSKSKQDRQFFYPKPFRREYVRTNNSADEFNIMCNGMRFDYEEVKKVMPQNTKYFTILREPSTLFDSIYKYYYDIIKAFPRAPRNSLESWLDHANRNFIGGAANGGFLWQLTKSGSFFDLGYNNLIEDNEYIYKALMEMESRFDLVLILEYFDESLILLKDLMCWDYSDIVYFKLNVRYFSSTPLSKRLTKKARKWNRADASLYDYFNRTLWQKIGRYGYRRMSNDVQELRSLNEKYHKECIKSADRSDKLFVKTGRKISHPPSVDIVDYQLFDDAKPICRKMIMSESEYTKLLLSKQGYRD